MAPLTCWSCHHYRPTACAQGQPTYPAGGPDDCPAFVYEPGADEAEREADDFEDGWL